MLKKITFAGVGIALLASPLLASADTLSDLQAQIQTLLAQIKALQERANVSAPSTGPAQPPANAANCVNLTMNMGPDDTDVNTNGNVTALQQFLGGRVTGYFGPMTLGLVQQWQASHGLVSSGDPESTGFGYVGPRTRAAIAQVCGNAAAQTTFSGGATGIGSGAICPAITRTACPAGQHYEYGPVTYDSARCPIQDAKCVPDSTSTATFSASPASGAAPLAVRFSTSAKSGTIDFGDGTSGQVQQGPLGYCDSVSGCWGGGYGASHTYTSAGTYTAKLTQDTQCGITNSIPGNPVYCPTTIGTVTITVTGGSTVTPTFSASPQSGAAPLAVTFAAGSLLNGQSYSVDFGDGSQTALNLICANDEGACSNGRNYAQTNHTYASAGTYAAKLIYQPVFSCPPGMGCPAVMPMPQTVGAVTITVTGGTKVTPTFSATPTSGTAPLSVSFGYPYNSSTSGGQYTVEFGDGTSGQMNPLLTMQACIQGSDCSQRGSWNANHTYTSAGTYTAKLTQNTQCGMTNSIPGNPIYCSTTIGTVTITVTGGSTACEVTDIYAENVPGYVYYNLFMKVRNLPGATSTTVPVVSITGAESWDNLTFSQIGYSGGITTLQASQTVNSTGINYIMERKYAIKPVSIGGAPIICTPMGGKGVGYPVPISTYPTTNTGSQPSASGSNPNLANALSALESALKALLADLAW